MAHRTQDMDETLETRRISASIFGNEKLAKIVLLLESEDGQDRVPRLGYGAMQLAGPGVIGLPDDVVGAIEVLRGPSRWLDAGPAAGAVAGPGGGRAARHAH